MTLSSRHQSNMPPAGSHDGNVSPEPRGVGPALPEARSYMALTGKKNTAVPFHFTWGKSMALKSLLQSEALDNQQVY